MNHETPLTEVAAYLPKASAQLLMHEHIGIQQTVLECIRDVLINWEQAGHHLDPLALDTALSGFVPTLIKLGRLVRENAADMHSRLTAADTLIERLGKTLTRLAEEAKES